MNITRFKIAVPLLYLLVAGFVFTGELYTRIYDRGNSEMSGLGTYLLTMPASSLVDWLFLNFFRVEKTGSSDASFIVVLGLSVILNTVFVYLIAVILIAMAKRVSEI